MQDREFNLKSSKWYLFLLTVFFLMTLLILLALEVRPEVKIIALSFLILYSSYLLWRRGLLRGSSAILSLRRKTDGSWLLFSRKKIYQAELRGDSTLTGFVSVLRFNVPTHYRPISIIIFPDALAEDHYRQLLVILKMA